MVDIYSNQYFSKQNSSSIQQAGSCVKIKNLTFNKSMSTDPHVLSCYVNVKSRFSKTFQFIIYSLYDLKTFTL